MSTVPALLSLLDVEHPIIQAPMAGTSTPELAAAVSNSGGLGSLGVGASSVDQARAAIRATKALTARPFNVNLFCHRRATADASREAAWLEYLAPRFAEFGVEPPSALAEIYQTFVGNDAMLAMLLAERPAVVSFHFGLPEVGWIRQLRQAGIVLLACATNSAEAVECMRAGVDAIVAQGVEAGGHRGVFSPELGDDGIGTLALVRMLVRQGGLPVIAAGGIMDGAGIAAALQLGAAGAQLGTAFVLCPESSASAAYREQMKSDRAHHTRITATISGRPARGLPNRMYEMDGAPALPDYPIVYDAGKALHAAASAKGNHEFAAYWAGQGAPMARELPAATLMSRLVEELRAS
ncbi:NAD(P)H-dependent flavin oxidoreductase [Steroidobacter sp.]|uniref:NAD(P)H-dependent flavin oxidoreductase n=1 Tax=Steroidobacter sp. TaxID=1978227 RepID=UPI001A3F0138|nr:nitronate monooxygenase [Steroidobacter sp.]MBL8267056.1 nitronate monooxygenase [Steroidobacter sp.]